MVKWKPKPESRSGCHQASEDQGHKEKHKSLPESRGFGETPRLEKTLKTYEKFCENSRVYEVLEIVRTWNSVRMWNFV